MLVPKMENLVLAESVNCRSRVDGAIECGLFFEMILIACRFGGLDDVLDCVALKRLKRLSWLSLMLMAVTASWRCSWAS